MTIEINSLEQLEELARIVKNYRLESLKIGDIEIKKTIHESHTLLTPKTNKGAKEKTEEELYDEDLFYSAV